MQVAIGVHFPLGYLSWLTSPFPTDNPNIYGNILGCSLASYTHTVVPADGDKITMEGANCVVPDRPIVPFIEGDGIGPDIWRATQTVIDASVEHAYQDARQIVWMEIYAGEKPIPRLVSGFRRKRSRRFGSSRWVSRDLSQRRSGAGSAR